MSSLPLSVEELEKFLICDVCLKHFDDGEKHARLLPCLHASCHSCLLDCIENDTIKCHSCGKIHSISNDIDTDFPRDYTRKDLDTLVKIKRLPLGVKCTSCRYITATHRCRECANYLCNDCVETQQTASITSRHKCLDIEKLKSTGNIEAVKHQQMCSIHPGKALELYCNKSTCQKPICVLCALASCKEHDGHTVQNIEDVAGYSQTCVQHKTKELRNTNMHVQKLTGHVQQEILDVEARELEISTEIDSFFDTLIEKLQSKRNELNKSLKSFSSYKVDILETQERKLLELSENIDEILRFCRQYLLHSNAPAVLQIEKVVQKAISDILETPYDKNPHETTSMGFSHANLEREVLDKVNELAIVWSSSIYPPNTKIEHDKKSTLKQYEPTPFRISFHDYMGQIQELEDSMMLDVKAFVVDPTGLEAALNVNFDKKAGVLHALVLPMLCGEHTLIVKADDLDVGQVKFDVKDAPLQDSKIDKSLLRDTKRHMLTLESSRCHADVEVLSDGKIFLNRNTRTNYVRNPLSLQTFNGTFGLSEFSHPGTYFYEIEVNMKILEPLERSSLAMELGVARRQTIDRGHLVCGQQFAWSMVGVEHEECNAVCLYIFLDGQRLYHEKIMENISGNSFRRTFGFFLDTDIGHWKIFNCSNGNFLCIIDGVDCSEPLIPTVAGYNASRILVTMRCR